MPTLLRQDGFEIRMYFDDHDPPHIHAFKAGGQAKIALDSLEVLPSLILVQGMSMKDAKKAIDLITENQINWLTGRSFWDKAQDGTASATVITAGFLKRRSRFGRFERCDRYGHRS
jgi:hypothetical protein